MTSIYSAESIHQRILNIAAAEHRPFNELLQYYAIERFLYRFGRSAHSQNFILKGALVFLAWKAPFSRPTRDMDFLGFTNNSVDHIVQVVHEVCMQPVESDGIVFDPESVQGEMINERADYQGVRVKFFGYLSKAHVHMRLDVGFADLVTPSPIEVELPTIFKNMNKPCLRAYPPETVIAEKLQSMIALGLINSRMKDFYDIWFMAQSMEFDFHLLKQAVFTTFNHRKTVVSTDLPSALTTEFAKQKQAMWSAFLSKNRIEDAPDTLVNVIGVLKKFLEPVIYQSEDAYSHWSNTGGWE